MRYLCRDRVSQECEVSQRKLERSVCDGKCDGDDCHGADGDLCGGESAVSMDLITSDSSILLNQIHDAVDIEQLKTMIKQLEAVKIALEAIDRFHEKSVLYARLEADAFIRLIELGGVKELRGYKRKTAEWLSEMSDDERTEWIAKCENGITIVEIYKSEHPSFCQKSKIEKVDSAVDLLRETIELSVAVKNPVDLSDFSKAVKESYKAKNEYQVIGSLKYADTAVDEMRRYLRDNGYVGVGESTGKYFPAKREYREEITKAIQQRFRQIILDIYSLRSIMDHSEIGKLHASDFIWEDNWHMTHGDEKFVVYPVMIALNELGLVDDLDVFEDAYHIKWNRENLYHKVWGEWCLKKEESNA